MTRLIVILTLFLILMPLAGSGPTNVRAQDATPSASSGRFSDLVDIGGRGLWLTCQGEGSPTVILESGSPFMTSYDWPSVQAPVAKFTHVCAYDRANVGQSDPAPTPRTVQQMADDLHALLTAAGIPGPYVLVATSFGPLVTRMYASTYPEDVAGIVLIDPLDEDLEARWQAVLPADLWARRIADFWMGNPEGIALDESYSQVRAAAPLPDVPLIVIVHGDASRDSFLIPTNWPVALLDPIWKELVAKEATLIPGGRLVVAERSGHNIMMLQSDLIIAAVEQVVMAARDATK
jgi:pimeloyl-ACP methyl ester carboxylesterase